MKDLFAILKTGLERTDASLDVTLKTLSLGAQGATTGQYVKGYASSTIQMVITIKHTRNVHTPLGDYTVIEAYGVTDTQVFEGDEIEDANTNYYRIEKVLRRDIGDKNVVYDCVLKNTLPASGSERTYPWPAPPGVDGGIGLNVGAVLFDALEITSILADVDVQDFTSATCSVSTVLSVAVT